MPVRELVLLAASFAALAAVVHTHFVAARHARCCRDLDLVDSPPHSPVCDAASCASGAGSEPFPAAVAFPALIVASMTGTYLLGC